MSDRNELVFYVEKEIADKGFGADDLFYALDSKIDRTDVAFVAIRRKDYRDILAELKQLRAANPARKPRKAVQA